MAQKRMFDKRITDSDRFTDLPNSSKALYFMAGMSADDRGFFQPRRLQKISGFTDDDFKVLIAKGYFIPFESGVMVITEWNKNNYLDKNRITETEYIDELKMLKLINEKYELNNGCLTNVKPMFNQYSIEENSIEENNNISSKKFEEEFEELWKLYPKKVGKKQSLRHYIKSRKDGIEKETIKEGLKKYIEYINNEKIPMKFIKDGSTWFNQESWNDERTVEHKETEEEWIARMEREIAGNESKRN